ncbi:YadA C-terminal domain-containing protein, partial [Aliivibrio sp. 1S165]
LKQTQHIALSANQNTVNNADLISSNSDAVDKNTADIQQNTNDIKDLRSDFKEMGKRVDGTAAMGMATSSLFQPYGIGKANVTVGLGNYNGANAVAFGSGIRIDEHVALRANVAYVDSTNDTGFGVGASYEW